MRKRSGTAEAHDVQYRHSLNIHNVQCTPSTSSRVILYQALKPSSQLARQLVRPSRTSTPLEILAIMAALLSVHSEPLTKCSTMTFSLACHEQLSRHSRINRYLSQGSTSRTPVHNQDRLQLPRSSRIRHRSHHRTCSNLMRPRSCSRSIMSVGILSRQ